MKSIRCAAVMCRARFTVRTRWMPRIHLCFTRLKDFSGCERRRCFLRIQRPRPSGLNREPTSVRQALTIARVPRPESAHHIGALHVAIRRLDDADHALTCGYGDDGSITADVIAGGEGAREKGTRFHGVQIGNRVEGRLGLQKSLYYRHNTNTLL